MSVIMGVHIRQVFIKQGFTVTKAKTGLRERQQSVTCTPNSRCVLSLLTIKCLSQWGRRGGGGGF